MSPRENKDETKQSPTKEVTASTVGAVLAQTRAEMGTSLEDVEKAIKVRKRYLSYIEEGNFEKLPDTVYSLGYVKSYADYLGFETAPIVSEYKKERMIHLHKRIGDSAESQKAKLGLSPVENQGFVLSSKTVLVGFAIILFVAIVGYLGFQVTALTSPPKITLNQSNDKVTTNFVIISGETDPGSDVLINNSPVLTNTDGSFSEKIAVVNGSNQIIVTAKNKLGKTSTVSKTVTANIANGGKEKALGNVSATVVDGVELLVKISNQATWVIVQADGVDVFRGTMLPNAQQLFKAKNKIKLTTGNTGTTELVITNAVVANKDLGKLGKEGQAKVDLEFSKDTQFQ